MARCTALSMVCRAGRTLLGLQLTACASCRHAGRIRPNCHDIPWVDILFYGHGNHLFLDFVGGKRFGSLLAHCLHFVSYAPHAEAHKGPHFVAPALYCALPPSFARSVWRPSSLSERSSSFLVLSLPTQTAKKQMSLKNTKSRPHIHPPLL